MQILVFFTVFAINNNNFQQSAAYFLLKSSEIDFRKDQPHLPPPPIQAILLPILQAMYCTLGWSVEKFFFFGQNRSSNQRSGMYFVQRVFFGGWRKPPQKFVFFMFQLWFSFKNNSRTNDLLVGIFETH